MKLYYKILFFLFFGHFAIAQNSSVAREINKIDSLAQNFQWETAQKKTDSLYSVLFGKREKNMEQLLEVRYRKLFLLDKQDLSPAKILKISFEFANLAEVQKSYSLLCKTYLLIALTYEKAENYELTDKYLNVTFEIYKKHHLEDIYSTYCIRKSSYCRFVNELDSSLKYAEKAKIYAEKYHNNIDLNDAYLLLGNYYSINKNYPKALEYNLIRLNFKRKNKSEIDGFYQFNNISRIFLKMKKYQEALSYSDSAYMQYEKLVPIDKYTLPELRYKIYDAVGNRDSAYHYFKHYHDDLLALQKEEEKTKTKELEEQYQNDKKEAVIQNKNRQMISVGSLLGVIIFGAVLLVRKNRQINRQNKIINNQVIDLSKTLEQKQILLSELQHRVKNNLQHVISILEIQKESVDFNNIDELIRGNQNRIHSMALLHKKLNVSDNVNDVDLKRYVTELSELVKDSYDNHKKQINLIVKCQVESISIEKALPIGLIITELVSNSMKHAFRKRSIGIIHIEITKDEITGQSKLYYSDNGDGFDFNKTSEKGLGQEIIKGLIDQLGGKTETKRDNGFELNVRF